jgi:hypothetical protein
LGLIIEALLDLVSRNTFINIARSAVIGMMAFVFLTANVYELYYYRQIGIIDREIAVNISKVEETEVYFKGQKDLILFNAKERYVEVYTNRSPNCTSAEWALRGLLEGNNSFPRLRLANPVFDGVKMPMPRERVMSSVLLGIDDERNVFPLKITEEYENKIILSRYDGREFGQVEILPDSIIRFGLSSSYR